MKNLVRTQKITNGRGSIKYITQDSKGEILASYSTQSMQEWEILFDFNQQKFEEEKEQLNQQVKQLKARKSQEERKARTKRLIEIGAAVESVLGRPIEHDELPKLIDFLKTQEQRGHFFSKAMNKDSQNYNSNNDEQD